MLIHDGNVADQGHYYSFTKDHTVNKWFKYNDHSVAEVSEEEVFSYAFGG